MPDCPKHSGVIERLNSHDREMELLREELERLSKVIGEVRDLLLHRPTWFITIVITILTSAVVVLLPLALK